MLIVRLFASVLLVLGLAVVSPEIALADEHCWSETDIDEFGKVTSTIVCDGDTADGKGLASGKRVCLSGSYVVPCASAQGTWYSPQQCYISPVDPPLDFSDPNWRGHTDGSLWYCRITGNVTGTPYIIWFADSTPPPDPETLARRAVAQMQLKPITIGIVPKDDPDSVGLVGMPIWLWADNPGDQTIGPISRSVSEGGFTVTATAKVDRIRWSLGDGRVKTCNGPGTPYKLSYGITESPTCGYRFEEQGEFTVTARSDWIVNWTGIGETGSFR
ncbi:MAG: hypothetical protein AAGC63_15140, partial [Propionicimonas sp.]